MKKLKKFFFQTQVDLDISKKNFNLGVNGKYSLDNLDFLQLNLDNIFKNDILNLNANFDYKKVLILI